MIHGAHVIVFSQDAESDLAFLRDLLGRPRSADAGGGWMIYALPPAEIAVHPSDENGTHRLYLMCDDIEAFRRAMTAKGVAVGDVQAQRWGLLVEVSMPGGGKLGVYEPRHASPNRPAARKARAPGPRRRKAPQAAKKKRAKPRSRR
jgi:hypothetical protein